MTETENSSDTNYMELFVPFSEFSTCTSHDFSSPDEFCPFIVKFQLLYYFNQTYCFLRHKALLRKLTVNILSDYFKVQS